MLFSQQRRTTRITFSNRVLDSCTEILSPFTGVFQFLFPTNDPNKLNYISLDKYPKFKGFTVDCKYKLKFVVSFFSFFSPFSPLFEQLDKIDANPPKITRIFQLQMRSLRVENLPEISLPTATLTKHRSANARKLTTKNATSVPTAAGNYHSRDRFALVNHTR